MLFRAVPKSLRAAITIGIGFFITISKSKNQQHVVDDASFN